MRDKALAHFREKGSEDLLPAEKIIDDETVPFGILAKLSILDRRIVRAYYLDHSDVDVGKTRPEDPIIESVS